MRCKVRLDTMQDVNKFVSVVSNVMEKVVLEDDDGHCVSARSILGALYSMEWANVYCKCDRDITAMILSWVI